MDAEQLRNRRDPATAADEVLPNPASICSVVQPIVRLDDLMVIGYEALARVDSEPLLPPDRWLARAQEAGLKTKLEILFLESASRLGNPPGDTLLFVNASPELVLDPSLVMLRSALPERLVIEITEQSAVDDYGEFKKLLARLDSNPVRFAIDDTGAGYSSLRHVIELSPDFLKLDRTLVRDIDRDARRHALVRALVAFAGEVGTSVIAEGIETSAELAGLIAAGVPLGQGYLIGQPGPAWPSVDDTLNKGRVRGSSNLGDLELEAALTRAQDPASACSAVVEHLFRLGQLIPSLYLEQNGHLRCVAQRGLWQVLDGLPPNAGITGRVWATGEPIAVDDVTQSPFYLEAVPGVVAEICVPIPVNGASVGALNVDSLAALPERTMQRLRSCASLLSNRLSALGWRPSDSAWQRAVQSSGAISGAAADNDAAAKILSTVLAASGMDSAGIVRTDREQPTLEEAIGPLAEALTNLDPRSLHALCHLVEGLSSCYTGSETTGLPYLGSESLREGGARAVVLLPLRANNVVLGALVLAHSRPMRLTPQLVEPLELLAGQAAATLKAVDLVEQLRRQAHHDGLTGLLNRVALERTLSGTTGQHTVLILDVDHFKQVNDVHGHLDGDHALRTLARGIIEALPEVPFFRLGGDEFTCVLPLSNSARAYEVAQTVRSVAREVLSRWSTAVSIGGAVSRPGDAPLDTLARADAALLWTKKHARGEMTLFDPDDEIAASRPRPALRVLA